MWSARCLRSNFTTLVLDVKEATDVWIFLLNLSPEIRGGENRVETEW